GFHALPNNSVGFAIFGAVPILFVEFSLISVLEITRRAIECVALESKLFLEGDFNWDMNFFAIYTELHHVDCLLINNMF
ncbi:hypothetical protein ACJX0J_005981, partial [Zea mays]